MAFVPLMLLAGIVLAFNLVGSLGALVTTGYGLTLLAKTAAVSAVLLMAALNKLRFVPALERGDASAAQTFRKALVVEGCAFFFVLLATAMLTTSQTLPLVP